jgi:hypothetical protein
MTALNMMAGANQPAHWCFGGKGLGIQQGMSVWVGLPKLHMMRPSIHLHGLESTQDCLEPINIVEY